MSARYDNDEAQFDEPPLHHPSSEVFDDHRDGNGNRNGVDAVIDPSSSFSSTGSSASFSSSSSEVDADRRGGNGEGRGNGVEGEVDRSMGPGSRSLIGGAASRFARDLLGGGVFGATVGSSAPVSSGNDALGAGDPHERTGLLGKEGKSGGYPSDGTPSEYRAATGTVPESRPAPYGSDGSQEKPGTKEGGTYANRDAKSDLENPSTSSSLVPVRRGPPTAQEFYLPTDHDGCDRETHCAPHTTLKYYSFVSTPLAPFAALHRSSGDAQNDAADGGNPPGVTGLLRRSAVLPGYGTDGNWVLVSVGGRSGWARLRRDDVTGGGIPIGEGGAQGGFTEARAFRALEGWMGNHVFLLRGKIMLGSDAPLFFFTNGLLFAGLAVYFLAVLPKLGVGPGHWNWCTSMVLAVMCFVFLWMSAATDPGILPSNSSPDKPPVPDDGTPIGGPL